MEKVKNKILSNNLFRCPLFFSVFFLFLSGYCTSKEEVPCNHHNKMLKLKLNGRYHSIKISTTYFSRDRKPVCKIHEFDERSFLSVEHETPFLGTSSSVKRLALSVYEILEKNGSKKFIFTGFMEELKSWRMGEKEPSKKFTDFKFIRSKKGIEIVSRNQVSKVSPEIHFLYHPESHRFILQD